MSNVYSRTQTAVDAAHNEEFRPIQNITGQLVSEMSTKLVASMVGVSDRSVRRWNSGVHHPSTEHQIRLRFISALGALIRDESRPWVVKNWFVAHNPLLEEQAPDNLVADLPPRSMEPEEYARKAAVLLAAANTFGKAA